jgi:Tol biopolymer transport system component
MSSTNQRWSLPLLLTVTLSAACTPEDSGDQAGPSENPSEDAAPAAPDTGSERVEAETDETRLANLQMLTFAGENAEAYWNPAADELIFQATRPGLTECDQIFTMDDRGRNLQLVSTGEGRTTCAYFFPGGDRILYSSTHAENRACPPPPDYSRGYVWALYDYDVYTANPDGSRLERLTETPGYDAEATISSDGEKIVFTSTRDGDLEIYTMDPDGTDLRRLTHEAGYDGGPFFSADGTKIVYRAYHPTDPEELEDYRSLLAEGLVRPATLEIFVNFGPFFHPDGERIIFSSNLHAPDGRNFDLYLINVDGTGLERVTTHPEFDGFPMFTSDGSRLVFASNRHNRQQGDTNVFVAEWVEDPATETEEEGP